MSRLIKSAAVEGIGAFPIIANDRGFDVSRPGPSPEAVEIERLQAVIAGLEDEIDRRDGLAHAIEEAGQKAVADAEARGRETGRAEAEDRQEQSLRALEKGIELAATQLDAELVALERLAPLLASACIERMFGAESDRADIVTDLIRSQIGRMRDQAVLRVEVSTDDFPDPDDLAVRLTGVVGRECELVALPALKAGECRMKLRLGSVDVGLDQQWGALRKALDEAMSDGVGS